MWKIKNILAQPKTEGLKSRETSAKSLLLWMQQSGGGYMKMMFTSNWYLCEITMVSQAPKGLWLVFDCLCQCSAGESHPQEKRNGSCSYHRPVGDGAPGDVHLQWFPAGYPNGESGERHPWSFPPNYEGKPPCPPSYIEYFTNYIGVGPEPLALVIDMLRDEVRQASPQSMMFADDIDLQWKQGVGGREPGQV